MTTFLVLMLGLYLGARFHKPLNAMFRALAPRPAVTHA